LSTNKTPQMAYACSPKWALTDFSFLSILNAIFNRILNTFIINRVENRDYRMAASLNSHPFVSPPCRCCLQPTHSFFQPNYYDNNGKYFVHCKTPGCPLNYATREIGDWLRMDLSQWDAVQHPNWKLPENLLEVA
jgi:hypothetical protein